MFDTSWDVDKYKNNYEPNEHWLLRRKFMVAHKGKFSEPKLICLARVFFNIEIFGCKYPEKTVNLMDQLAREVAAEFRDKRKNKLKRNFAGAQDVAGVKTEGVKRLAESVDGPQSEQLSNAVDKSPATKKPCLDREQSAQKKILTTSIAEQVTQHNTHVNNMTDYTEALQEIAKSFTLMIPVRGNSETEQNPIRIMHYNFPGIQMGIYFQGSITRGVWNCEVWVSPSPLVSKNEKPMYLIGSSRASSQRDAKLKACTVALANLKKFCNFIEPNPAWFLDGLTPEFIKNRIPCNKTPRSYLIMTKKDTEYISEEVADTLIENLKRSSNEDMFFLDVEYNENEKRQLMNRARVHQLGFRHFGLGVLPKEHHVCIYKRKSAGEIVEEARTLGWNHPKYLLTLREDYKPNEESYNTFGPAIKFVDTPLCNSCETQPNQQCETFPNRKSINTSFQDSERLYSKVPGHQLSDTLSCSNKEEFDGERHINLFPDSVFSQQYRDNPPSPEMIGKFLEGFVIFFGVRNNSELEKDPFIVIQDSFSTSDRFGRLKVEEISGCLNYRSHPKHICVLRWRGMMLMRAEGKSCEEARYKASILLINALAHTCYTVQAKYSYYCGGKLPKFMLKNKEKQGFYKIVERSEIAKFFGEKFNKWKAKGFTQTDKDGKRIDEKNINCALNFIDDFFKTDTFCELLFGDKNVTEYSRAELNTIFKYVESCEGLQGRAIKGYMRGIYTAVSRIHTPQQICNYLLRLDGDSIRYRLIPPQGPWIELLGMDMQYSPGIIKKISQQSTEQSQLK